MPVQERLSQAVAVATHITPAAARAAGSYVSAAVDTTRFARLVAVLQTGTIAGAGTINARFQHNSASASNDGGWADVSSASCITSTFASTSNDKLGQLEYVVDQYPSNSRFVRVLASAATSTWLGGVVVMGEPILKPATDYDSADVVQTVVF
jgi:hypothetical protein